MSQRILLIDDDVDMRRLMRLTLETAGYEVVEADEGQTGMQRHQESPADVILLDIFMPGQEGLETIRALHRVDPSVKIIAISGGGQGGNPEPYLELARLLGAKRALRKPFSPQELLDVVQAVLQGA